MDVRKFLTHHYEKLIFVIIACCLVYTVIQTFLRHNAEWNIINSELPSFSDTIKRKIQTSKPTVLNEELNIANSLRIRFTSPPDAEVYPSHVFMKFTKEGVISDTGQEKLLRRTESASFPQLKVNTPGDTEFIFKGGTPRMALIQVRKLFNEKWWEESFVVKEGDYIGAKKTIGKRIANFATYCKLVEIISSAQKPFIMRKNLVIRDEKNEFAGINIAQEAHTITTPKIVFEDKKGKLYELWIGEKVNLGTETVTAHPRTNIFSVN